ncbi:acetylxylan esterase [Pseudokineococcus lusitanus]|uniref:Cephalosporin-C deacetylase n=1 Tax=Pseudokineococcus lusitanus TaxID=763993 RepID=A0A3N1GA17_9ACTN|nr:acetylxylan esterase [Pseudokineococcus lusitanus]ROP27061.1 cephalosporin-C deacetylase [Pseudokineococcus lusitanus]
MHTDLSEPQLWEHRSTLADPDGVDEFWARTLAEARAVGGPLRAEPVTTDLRTLEVHDVTFPGFGGEPVRAWLRRPVAALRGDAPLPVVVEYVGYGGGRGEPEERLLWASAGFAHLLVDTRGQGSGWSRGDTPDSGPAGPQVPGVMTRGVTSPETSYYRRFLTDAARAVDAARALPSVGVDVDPSRVAVMGTSQGGAAALAAGALVPDVAAVVAQVPFLCDVPRALAITDADPFHEVTRYLARHRSHVDAVLRTLAHVDGVVMARRGRAPARFSAALMDAICPPSTVFGAFHAYAGPKEIVVWPYNGHEGGETEDERGALAFLRHHLRHP